MISKTSFAFPALIAALSVISGCDIDNQEDSDYNLYYKGISSAEGNAYIDVSENQSFMIERNFTETFDLYIGVTPATTDARSRSPNEHTLIGEKVHLSSFQCEIDLGYNELVCALEGDPTLDKAISISNLVNEIPTNLYLYASIKQNNGERVTGYKLRFN